MICATMMLGTLCEQDSEGPASAQAPWRLKRDKFEKTSVAC